MDQHLHRLHQQQASACIRAKKCSEGTAMTEKAKPTRTVSASKPAAFGRWFAVGLVTMCILSPTMAEDWPSYMHDNARSGVTTEGPSLDGLNDAWVYVPPAPPRVAWDGGAPWDAFRASDISSAMILGSAAYFGIPMSSTHVDNGTLMGTGLTRGKKAVKWGTMRSIIWAWILSAPLSAVFAYVLYNLIIIVL